MEEQTVMSDVYGGCGRYFCRSRQGQGLVGSAVWKIELACLLSARQGAAKNKTMAGMTQYSSNNSWYMNWNNENLNNNNKNNNNYVRAFAAIGLPYHHTEIEGELI